MNRVICGVLAAVAWGLPLRAGTYQTEFTGQPAEWSLSGDRTALVRRDGALFHDCSTAVSDKYRYLSLKSPEVMDGDFSVEFTFHILRIDHWNSLRLSVASVKEKAWSAVLCRRKKQPGTELFSCGVTVAGEKTDKEVATKTMAGTFRIERTASLLTLSFRPSTSSAFAEMLRVEPAPPGAATATLSFDTPPSTASVVRLIGFSQRWSKDTERAFTPLYSSRQVVADGGNGTVRLLALEKGVREEDGTLRIAPGGRALYGVRGPVNLKQHGLGWRSSGALKVTAVQPGSAEAIQLGEVLLWDAVDHELGERGASLAGLVTRNAAQRHWVYPHLSCDNFFFVTVAPALDREITFGDLTLSGAPLRMAKPFRPVATARGKAVPKGNVAMLAWEVPEKARGWFDDGTSPFESGDVRELDDVPYMLNPTLLSPACPSVSIGVNAKAGMLRFLHAAGPQGKVASPLVASYLVVYEDGTTETVFAVLRWNCGVWADDFLARGCADFTWWGPPGFTRGKAHYMPKPPFGVSWNTLYSARIMNPYPEKVVREIIAYQMPEDTRQFALLGITLHPPENSCVALVEPDEATFEPGRPLGITVMGVSALPGEDGEKRVAVRLVRPGGSADDIGNAAIATRGGFSGGRAIVHPSGFPGPVRIVAGNARSSLLGLMPEASPADQPCHLTMIAGGGEARGDFERIRRLGYDAVKVHLPWVEETPGEVEWPGWRERIERIAGEGLKIGLRNHIARSQPEYVRKQGVYLAEYEPGRPPKPLQTPDPADPLFRRSVVNYYHATGELAAAYPETVFSINANYGVRNGLGTKKLRVGETTMENFRRKLAEEVTLEELSRKLGVTLHSFNEVTPDVIMADRSGTLLSRLARMNMADLGSLQREVAKAIRAAGCSAHLTFNTPFHLTEHKLLGLNTAEYLRLAREFPPGSIFHETSDRYCLSFSKWLLAKRTLGLLYGDEGNQCPPTEEHNALAYQWMAMMQCYDALYCQWFGGKPAARNVASLKPGFKLLYNAEYLPDPVALAVCLDSGFAEAPETFRRGLHQTTMPHYSLANLLRVLNINADRYLVDSFPELDRDVACRLLIDDMSRDLTPAFGDRIEAFIRRGGTFLATLDTDSLNRYAFFRRFGVEIGTDGAIDGTGVSVRRGVRSVAEKRVGEGKLLILGGSWSTGHWDPGEPEAYLAFARELLEREGGFRPIVHTDVIDVFATPYRTHGGDILIQLLNITSAPHQVTFSVDQAVAGTGRELFDLGRGTPLHASSDDGRISGTTEVPALGSTLVRVSSAVSPVR